MRRFSLTCNASESANSILKIEDFVIRFNKFELQVNAFSLVKGAVYLMSGPNGSGKSTFLKTLAGLDNREFLNKITYLPYGKLFSSFSAIDLVKIISYMPQIYKRPELSVYNFLLHARYPYMRGLSYNLDDFTVLDKIAKEFGLSHLLENSFNKLSGGEQLRVLMARISLLDPKIVLFDEPSSFLDKEGRKLLIDFIKKLSAEAKTVVIASHDEFLFRGLVRFVIELEE